jgi:hypothetical protein
MGDVHLASDGAAACTATVTIRGYEMERFIDLLDKPDAGEQIAEALLGDKAVSAYDVESAEAAYLEEDDYIQVNLTTRLKDVSSVLDGNLFFSPCLVPIMDNPFVTDRRLFPIDFMYNQKRRHKITIHFPEGYEIADLPEEIVLNTEGLRFNRTFRKKDGAVEVSMNMFIQKPFFEVGEYAEVKGLFDAMAVSAGDQIALSQAETVPASSGGTK